MRTNTDTFQFRHFPYDQHHVDALVKALKTAGELDPMTLWRDPHTNELVIVDGHHRFEAYRQAGHRRQVRARVHECSVEQAQLLALKENGKTRLPLTHAERSDAAWALVCLGPEVHSRSAVSKATGVADGTVATMRRTRIALLERDPEDDLPRRWWEARAALKDIGRREYTDEERDEMIEAKAAQLDEQIGAKLGFMVSNQIEAACGVVAGRLGRQGLAYLFEYHIRDELRDVVDPYGRLYDGTDEAWEADDEKGEKDDRNEYDF
ncbi:ParB N-terminal domain-containing protein [Gymnodinialimonas sp. 57CJ19]|uniref:ParB/RepB/Spo0J family partition protein n=1 Tax=Gymnodinialimonas sp. 57CJ19 TaxID=3138498 RepID=UPI0031345A1C